MLLHLRANTAQEIVDPSREKRITPHGDFHPHVRCKQASLSERPEEHEFHVWVCSGALEGPANERSVRQPQRELDGKQKQRGPRRLVKSEHASGSDQLREGTHNSRGIGQKQQNATAYYPIPNGASLVT